MHMQPLWSVEREGHALPEPADRPAQAQVHRTMSLIICPKMFQLGAVCLEVGCPLSLAGYKSCLGQCTRVMCLCSLTHGGALSQHTIHDRHQLLCTVSLLIGYAISRVLASCHCGTQLLTCCSVIVRLMDAIDHLLYRGQIHWLKNQREGRVIATHP